MRKKKLLQLHPRLVASLKSLTAEEEEGEELGRGRKKNLQMMVNDEKYNLKCNFFKDDSDEESAVIRKERAQKKSLLTTVSHRKILKIKIFSWGPEVNVLFLHYRLPVLPQRTR